MGIYLQGYAIRACGFLLIYRYIVENELREVTPGDLGPPSTALAHARPGAYVDVDVSPLWDTNEGRRTEIALQSPINGPLQAT